MNPKNEQIVFKQYEEVRLSGMTNMLDRRTVSEIADSWGYEELATVASGREEYSALLANYAELAAKYSVEDGRGA